MSNDTVTLHTDPSISAGDSGITTIPLVTSDAIWSNAIELLSTSKCDHFCTRYPKESMYGLIIFTGNSSSD